VLVQTIKQGILLDLQFSDALLHMTQVASKGHVMSLRFAVYRFGTGCFRNKRPQLSVGSVVTDRIELFPRDPQILA
jgi:hypothetical protein